MIRNVYEYILYVYELTLTLYSLFFYQYVFNNVCVWWELVLALCLDGSVIGCGKTLLEVISGFFCKDLSFMK